MNNNMLKSKLVMLPVNQKAIKEATTINDLQKEKSHLVLLEGKLTYDSNSLFHSNLDQKAQHLYLISDREIKEGDWYISDENNVIKASISTHKYCKCSKIEATTNPELHLPLPKDADLGMGTSFKYDKKEGYKEYRMLLPNIGEPFIKAYIESYNNGKPITEVMIEIYIFEENIVSIRTRSDNTVIIHHIKETFTRDEIISLLKEFRNGLLTVRDDEISYTNRFIEENL